MMPIEPKSIPIHVPRVAGRIVEGLRAAIADPKTRPRAYIRLSASGGVRGEAYDFEYRIDAGGRTSARLLDELKGRRVAGPSVSTEAADPARFAALTATLDIEALMRSETPTGGFPPDSVVGRLEVSDGEQTATFLFMADDEQARRARLPAPDSLRKAVDAVYRAAAAHLHTEDVRP
jgi:hypothetical protein